MHRKIAKAIIVVLISISAGVANAQAVKVACVGDSITALPSSWCGTLSTELGSGYTVMNFGVSGTNLAKNVSQPYWSSAQYTPSHTFNPDIVIIMLGTNDAFTRSWSSAMGHFVADYEELIDTYTSLTSKPKPYIIIPTPIGTSPFGHDGDLLATEVIPLIKEVAMTKMVPTIDGFTLFGGAMFDTSLYSASDQVHPNAQGQQKLGEEVHKVLMETGALGGGSAGSGATAGTSAGSGGMAAIAGSGAAPVAGTGAMATAGAGAVAGAGAGTTNAGGAGAAATTSPIAGSRASAAGSSPVRASTGGAGTPATAGVTATASNPIAAAGSGMTISPAPSSEDGGCRAAGSSSSQGGATATFVLLIGAAIRSMKRRRSQLT